LIDLHRPPPPPLDLVCDDSITDQRKLLAEGLPPGYEQELLEGYAKAKRCSKFFLEISKGNSSFIPNDCVPEIMASMGETLEDEVSEDCSNVLGRHFIRK